MSSSSSSVSVGVNTVSIHSTNIEVPIWKVDDIHMVPLQKTLSLFNITNIYDAVVWNRVGNTVDTVSPAVIEHIRSKKVLKSKLKTIYKAKALLFRDTDKWLTLDKFIEYCEYFKDQHTWRKFNVDAFTDFRVAANVILKGKEEELRRDDVELEDEDEEKEKEMTERVPYDLGVRYRTREWQEKVSAIKEKMIEDATREMHDRVDVRCLEEVENMEKDSKRKRSLMDQWAEMEKSRNMTLLMKDPTVRKEAIEMVYINGTVSENTIHMTLNESEAEKVKSDTQQRLKRLRRF